MALTASDRLIATASRLFQERGYALVGINEIIAEAGVARMSLYNNFRSKEDLAVAVYRSLSVNRRQTIDKAIEASNSAEDAVIAIFGVASALAEKPGFRGCTFINLAANLETSDTKLIAVVADHKMAIRKRFELLADEIGARQPRTLALQLLNLWDGAIVEAAIMQSSEPVDAAIEAARLIIKAGRSPATPPE